MEIIGHWRLEAEPRVPAYVEVSNFTVKETFDAKYKSSLPKLMMEAATKTIEREIWVTKKFPHRPTWN